MKEKNKVGSRRRYDAVQIAIGIKERILAMHANGRSISSLSSSFGVSKTLLYKWKQMSQESKLGEAEKEINKVKRLEKLLKEVEEERDI